ncbi:hypothetical protein TorRG33x02_018960 [Trema orientale]|uniref:Uncharacterized protein n=1 Tax=Trema orientale TaxID=63057 RepID=A0A2P5FWF3_TREOI|nr:hypothetical protein TorRG33x02_018960 [Trema orientale]
MPLRSRRRCCISSCAVVASLSHLRRASIFERVNSSGPMSCTTTMSLLQESIVRRLPSDLLSTADLAWKSDMKKEVCDDFQFGLLMYEMIESGFCFFFFFFFLRTRIKLHSTRAKTRKYRVQA